MVLARPFALSDLCLYLASVVDIEVIPQSHKSDRMPNTLRIQQRGIIFQSCHIGRYERQAFENMYIKIYRPLPTLVAHTFPKGCSFQILGMVPAGGLEPPSLLQRGILNPLCLPIPPRGQIETSLIAAVA